MGIFRSLLIFGALLFLSPSMISAQDTTRTISIPLDTLSPPPDLPDSLVVDSTARNNKIIRPPLQAYPDLVKDTQDVFFFYPLRSLTFQSFNDTLINDFQNWDAIRQQEVPLAHLGNPGSATKSLFFQAPGYKGFRVGLEAWDLYRFTPKDLPYYQLSSAFTHLQYNQGNTQGNSRFSAQFSRNFEPGFNYSLLYDRVNQTGYYLSQEVENTSFTNGLWYRNKSNRYEFFLYYTYNEIQQNNNGGVNRDQFSGRSLSDESRYPVEINDLSQMRIEDRAFYLMHRTNIGGNAGKRVFRIEHHMNYSLSKYRFFDTNPDSAYYKDFRTDTRGIRFATEHRSFQNSFFLSTDRSDNDQIQFGLSHMFHWVDQYPRDSSLQNLFLEGKFSFKIKEIFRLNTEAHLGILANAGDYRAAAFMKLKVGKNADLNLHFQQPGLSAFNDARSSFYQYL